MVNFGDDTDDTVTTDKSTVGADTPNLDPTVEEALIAASSSTAPDPIQAEPASSTASATLTSTSAAIVSGSAPTHVASPVVVSPAPASSILPDDFAAPAVSEENKESQEVKSLKEKLASKEKEYTSLEESRDALTLELKSREEIINNLNTESKTKDARLAAQELNIKTLQQHAMEEHDKNERKLEEAESRLKEEVKKVSDKLTEVTVSFQKAIHSLEGEKASLSQQVTDLTSANNDLASKLSASAVPAGSRVVTEAELKAREDKYQKLELLYKQGLANLQAANKATQTAKEEAAAANAAAAAATAAATAAASSTAAPALAPGQVLIDDAELKNLKAELQNVKDANTELQRRLNAGEIEPQSPRGTKRTVIKSAELEALNQDLAAAKDEKVAAERDRETIAAKLTAAQSSFQAEKDRLEEENKELHEAISSHEPILAEWNAHHEELIRQKEEARKQKEREEQEAREAHDKRRKSVKMFKGPNTGAVTTK